MKFAGELLGEGGSKVYNSRVAKQITGAMAGSLQDTELLEEVKQVVSDVRDLELDTELEELHLDSTLPVISPPPATTATNPNPPTFLTIPQELRNHIYELSGCLEVRRFRDSAPFFGDQYEVEAAKAWSVEELATCTV